MESLYGVQCFRYETRIGEIYIKTKTKFQGCITIEWFKKDVAIASTETSTTESTQKSASIWSKWASFNSKILEAKLTEKSAETVILKN